MHVTGFAQTIASTTTQVTEALDKASNDKRIKAVLATLGDGLGLEGVAHAQELRQSFHRFRWLAQQRQSRTRIAVHIVQVSRLQSMPDNAESSSTG